MRLLLLLFAIANISCQTSPRVFSLENQPAPQDIYTAELQWSEFSSKFSAEDKNKTCVYHLVDFTIKKDGSIEDAFVSDSSSSVLQEYSLAAVNAWRYGAQDKKQKGRVAMIYTDLNEQAVFLLDPNTPTNKPEPVTQDNPEIIPVHRIPPKMPRQAARIGINGYAIVSFNVLKDGSVGDVKIVESKPPRLYDRPSLEAVSKWKYKPVSEDTKQSVRLDYRFVGANDCMF